MAAPGPKPDDPTRFLRRAVLAVLLFGSAGVLTELGLIGHFEDPAQFIPLVLLVAVLLTGAALAMGGSPRAVRAFRAVGVLCVLAGVAGVLLHYRGNVEFELEMYPGRGGWELFREAMTGATPVLAPGTMSVVGLLALLVTWRLPSTPHRG